jgi:hypothetical protein
MSSRPDKKQIQGKGTVKQLSFEGGFYGIVGDDGKELRSLESSPEFMVDGLRVRFTAITTDHIVSFRTWEI